MIYAYIVLILIGSNLFNTAKANPITPNDVNQEKAIISPANCIVKLNTQSRFANSMSALTASVLTTGIAAIDNKLESQLNYPTIPPLTIDFAALNKTPMPPRAYTRNKPYTCHHPDNNLPNFLADETSLSKIPPNVKQFNLLKARTTLQAPACLTFKELEDYIRLRVDQNLELGAYWRELHQPQRTANDLALLRWFDYLDENTSKQPVTVYTCTTYQLR